MYSDDSHDASPSPGGAGTGVTNFISLYSGYKALMKNYVGLNGASSPRDRLFSCPADVFNPDCFFTNPSGLFPPPGVHLVKNSIHDLADWDYSSYVFNGGDNIPRLSGKRGFSIPGLSGVKLSAVRHPDRALLLLELPSIFPYSWHAAFSHGAGPTNWNGLVYNDSRNVASFVDGHVSYVKMYWSGWGYALLYDPPASYDYQWSPD
jgi:hypothetical protein